MSVPAIALSNERRGAAIFAGGGLAILNLDAHLITSVSGTALTGEIFTVCGDIASPVC